MSACWSHSFVHTDDSYTWKIRTHRRWESDRKMRVCLQIGWEGGAGLKCRFNLIWYKNVDKENVDSILLVQRGLIKMKRVNSKYNTVQYMQFNGLWCKIRQLIKWKHWDMCTMCTLYNVIQRKADSIANYNTIAIQYIALHDGNIPYFSAMQSVWNWQKCFIVIINRFGRHMAKKSDSAPSCGYSCGQKQQQQQRKLESNHYCQPLMTMQMAPLLWRWWSSFQGSRWSSL